MGKDGNMLILNLDSAQQVFASLSLESFELGRLRLRLEVFEPNAILINELKAYLLYLIFKQ